MYRSYSGGWPGAPGCGLGNLGLGVAISSHGTSSLLTGIEPSRSRASLSPMKLPTTPRQVFGMLHESTLHRIRVPVHKTNPQTQVPNTATWGTLRTPILFADVPQ